MKPEQWKKYLGHAKQPDSLTSEDPRRRIEAEMFVTFATHEWNPERNLLVLGCGDGYEVKVLREMGWKNARGITFYDGEFKNVRKQGLQNIIELGDFHDMPFPNAMFDYVISKETLEHAISPFIVLAEINRVMKIDGRFVHYIPEGEAKQSDPYHYMCAPSWLWSDLMRKAGFSVGTVEKQLDQNKYSGYKEIETPL